MIATVIKKIDEKRCRWHGHVKRVGNDRLPKLLMNWQPDGRNRRGRPKKRWRHNLRKGLERYSQGEIETEGREQWKKRIKKTFI